MNTKSLTFLFLLSAISVRVTAAGYTFTPINYPDAASTTPQGINDSGQVVGTYRHFVSDLPLGFLLKNGVYTVITGRPGSLAVGPNGINNNGQIVGTDGPSGQGSSFLLSGGVYSDVAYPGCFETVATGISNNGQIVGLCQQQDNSTFNFVMNGGVYSKLPDAGQPATALGINNSGQVVGSFGSTAGFLFSAGVYTTITGPPGALSAQATGINDNGQIVGYYVSNTTGFLEDHGFILAGGVYTTIDVKQPAENLFFGINNSAAVVGGFGIQGGGFLGVPTAPLSISSLTPNSAAAGGLAFEMTVNGSGFPADAVVHWNGTALSTTYVSASQINAFVTAGLLSTAGTASVTVVSSETPESNALTFTISSAVTQQLSIRTPPILPVGHVGTAYSQAFIVGGGVKPYTWSLIAGAMPSGLSLSSAGVISGIPTAAEDLSFTVQVTDAASSSVTKTYSLRVYPAIATEPSFVGSMAHIAAEENWITTFTLVNKQGAAATAQLSFFGDPADATGDGPLPLPLTFPQQQSTAAPAPTASLSQSISANGSLIVETAGPQTPPVQAGSAQLAASGDVDGFAIFHQIPTAQEAVVPMETRNAASYLLAFDNTNGVVLGVAVENVSTQAATVGVVLRDGSGAVIGNGTLALGGSAHTAFVLSTQFPVTAARQGTAEFDTPSGGQISVLGIRFTPPNNALTTIPALANVGPGGGSIAHIATGNGWQTTFVLVNAGASAAAIHLKFFADVTGTALALPLSFPQTGSGAATVASSVDQTLAAGATLLVQSAGPLSDPAPTVGSAQLITTGNVSGFVIFRYNPNGQEAVVPLESRNATGYLVAFDNTGGTATGIAINSVSAQAASVPVVIRDDSGAQIGSDTLSLAANGHLAFTLGSDKYPATANIRGTLEFDTPSGGQIGVLGIRIPAAHTFTTLPALVK